MTIKQLKVFIRVAKLKSFTQTSKSLNISQPSVTIIVQHLQRELGTKLFDRLGNKIQLTRAGEELVGRAEDILARLAGLKERVDEITGARKGRLIIGGSLLPGYSFLPLAVHKFSRQHPGIDVSLKVEGSSFIEKALLEGEIDIAIVSRVPQSSLLVVRNYREEEIVVVASSSHPLAKKRSVSLGVLSKEPFSIGKRGESQIRDDVESLFAKKGVSLSVGLEVSSSFGSGNVIRTAVIAGLGLGFTFRESVKWYTKAGQLKILNVPELKLKRRIVVAVHKNRKKSQLVRAFDEFLKRYK